MIFAHLACSPHSSSLTPLISCSIVLSSYPSLISPSSNFNRYFAYLHMSLVIVTLNGIRFAMIYIIDSGVYLLNPSDCRIPMLYVTSNLWMYLLGTRGSFRPSVAHILTPYSIIDLTAVSTSASLTAGAIHCSVCIMSLTLAIARLLFVNTVSTNYLSFPLSVTIIPRYLYSDVTWISNSFPSSAITHLGILSTVSCLLFYIIISVFPFARLITNPSF